MKKFYYLVRMTFLEKMAYTKAVWFNTIGTLVSIFYGKLCLWERMNLLDLRWGR